MYSSQINNKTIHGNNAQLKTNKLTVVSPWQSWDVHDCCCAVQARYFHFWVWLYVRFYENANIIPLIFQSIKFWEFHDLDIIYTKILTIFGHKSCDVNSQTW